MSAIDCKGARPGAGVVVERDTVDGVEVVRSDTVDHPLEWRIEEVWRLGSLDGPDALFGVTEMGLAAAGGRLYVLDAGNHRVLVVDFATGRIVSRFGHDGDGPFELRRPHELWASADSTFVLEGTRRSLLAFSAAGEPLWTRPIEIWAIGYVGPTRVGPDGWYFPVVQAGADSSTLALLSASGADTSSVYESNIGGERVIRFDDCGTRVSVHLWPVGSPELIWSAAPWGVAVNGTAGYTVEVLGAKRMEIRRPFGPRPLDDAEAHKLLRPTLIRTRCGIDEDDFLAKQGMAPELQLIERLALSPSGELWVRRRTTDPGRPGPTDVFDGDGAYLGSLRPDAPFPAVFARDGSFVTLEQDSLGVEYVVDYTIHRREERSRR